MVGADLNPAACQVSPGGNSQHLHVFTTPQKCCPVLIEKHSNGGVLRAEPGLENAARIVCGSWSSDPVLYGDDPLATLKEQLEDAMRDEGRAKENRLRKLSSTPSSSSSSK